MGSSKQVGNASNLRPEQSAYLSSVLSGLGPQAQAGYQQFLQPMDVGQQQELFQQAFVNPALQTLERQVLPAIQQRFVDMGAGRSSALNQALAGAATDVSTMLGGQFGNFYQQQQQNLLNALSGLGGLATQQTQQPIIQQRQGLLGPILGAAGQFYGARG